jgi:hypothetical protein
MYSLFIKELHRIISSSKGSAYILSLFLILRLSIILVIRFGLKVLVIACGSPSRLEIIVSIYYEFGYLKRGAL